MKDPFKNPLAPKKKENGTWPWNFNAPTKDQACSGSLSAGDNYGVGYRSPTGKFSASGLKSGVIPQETKCISPSDMIDKEPS